jgi:hypothetical protein
MSMRYLDITQRLSFLWLQTSVPKEQVFVNKLCC